VEYPSFSHDSRFIYFLHIGRDQGIFRISVTGGKEERVVDMTNWHLTGYWGFSMSLDLTTLRWCRATWAAMTSTH
jgi:hypothetical protein